jgi:hypothetical protein
MNQQALLQFLLALGSEFIQNVFPIVCFIIGLWLWPRDKRKQAIIWLVSGAVIGALLIRYTEVYISGYEPIMVTIVNIISFSLFMLLFVMYLGTEARWSNRKMDWLLGGLSGVFLSLAQGIADPETSVLAIVVHCIALGVSFPLILIAIRSLKNTTFSRALTGALLIVVISTLAIGLVDYSYLILIG